jgi:rhodanese-related sulfurtransferase
VDVREQDEWEEFHVEGTIHWPLSKILEGGMTTFESNKQVLFYCKKGVRSLEAISALKDSVSMAMHSIRGGVEAL